MIAADVEHWKHEHIYLGAAHDENARRTLRVVGLTVVMMVAEIVAGTLTGSMALLADGLHMATHAGALGVAAAAYAFAKRHAKDPAFSFGTGKVGELAGFGSALLLGLFSIGIAVESVMRLFSPIDVAFVEATLVAGLGLVVNLVSAWLLVGDHDHESGHGHGFGHGHDFGAGHDHHSGRHSDHASHHSHHHHEHAHHAHHGDHGDHGRHRDRGASPSRDNNLRAAYLHVLADALTSILAIVALLCGRYFGWRWLDPAIGIVGAVVIGRWSWLLVRSTAAVLLDATDASLAARARALVEAAGDARIVDLHVWRVGPDAHAAIVSVVGTPGLDGEVVRGRLVSLPALAHVSIEVRTADRRDRQP
ncbi:MAG: cation diffusion facilitator family transporter [Burkholderiaceae bacterium]